MYVDSNGLFASNMGSFGGINGGSGDGGGDGDGIKAYEGYDDEVPALFRFIHWCLGTTPDSIKTINRAEHGRVCQELSKPNGDRRVSQSTLTRSREASALDAELIRRLAEAGVDHNAGAIFYVTPFGVRIPGRPFMDLMQQRKHISICKKTMDWIQKSQGTDCTSSRTVS